VLLHRFGQLPDDDLLDGEQLAFLESGLFFEEALEARSVMSLAHDFISFWRLRANQRHACLRQHSVPAPKPYPNGRIDNSYTLS
jgi:hypothetical protein